MTAHPNLRLVTKELDATPVVEYVTVERIVRRTGEEHFHRHIVLWEDTRLAGKTLCNMRVLQSKDTVTREAPTCLMCAALLTDLLPGRG